MAIPIIRGRSYHPQTQGSVEKANGTFKDRLYSIWGEEGIKNWVSHLPEIALVINTTRPSTLPAYVTPYEVWFGRKPWWLNGESESSIEHNGDENEPLSELEGAQESATEEIVVSALHRRVAEKQAIEAKKMIKKGGKKTTFANGQVILLHIPAKNRLAAEAKRLPCRIIDCVRGAYCLLSQYGQLQGRYQSSTLKAVVSGADFGIPLQPDPKGKTIKLPAAVTLSANRKSVSAQQAIGKAATRKRKADKIAALEAEAIADVNYEEEEEEESRGEGERGGEAWKRAGTITRAARLAAQEAEAIAHQDDLDEAFARDVEGAIARNESREISRPSGPAITPTPASRAKRVRRKAVVFEKGTNRKS
jgi:hypothetical protein